MEQDKAIDQAINELRDRLTRLDREIKVRASDIKFFIWLYMEGDEGDKEDDKDTLVNYTRRNNAGNIEVRTVNRTMHTSSVKERTPEEFDKWREALERM